MYKARTDCSLTGDFRKPRPSHCPRETSESFLYLIFRESDMISLLFQRRLPYAVYGSDLLHRRFGHNMIRACFIKLYA